MVLSSLRESYLGGEGGKKSRPLTHGSGRVGDRNIPVSQAAVGSSGLQQTVQSLMEHHCAAGTLTFVSAHAAAVTVPGLQRRARPAL